MLHAPSCFCEHLGGPCFLFTLWLPSPGLLQSDGLSHACGSLVTWSHRMGDFGRGH